jgi:preprotein translocase subunit SecB
MEVGLNTSAVKIQDDFYDVTVTLNVTAKVAEQTIFLVEAKEAGIFLIRGVPEGELGQVLGVHCPNIIFPFAREVVSDAVSRMGFPPVYLAPINFEALYQQQLQNEMQKMEQSPTGVTIQ